MAANGYVEYLAIDECGHCVKVVYYHNLMGCYYAVDGYRKFINGHPSDSFKFSELVEIKRSPELENVVI